MDSDSSRRYTDREVAVVLRRASEIEEAGGPGAGGALSRADLEEIAREVGISQEAIGRALAELEHRKEPGALVVGAPRVRRAARAVQGELNEDAMARLIRLVDERAESNGVISEALGSVRWTSSERFGSTQVSITPEAGETRIQVVEKSAARLKGALHGVPAAWGLIGAMGVAGGLGLAGAGAALLFVAGAGMGLGAGRLAWNLISARSARRVERLAAELSREAKEAVGQGLVTKGDEGGPEGSADGG
jgi:hypothetical protein